jgi:hypothetical protein
LSEQFETVIERIKRSFAMTASQMRCPHHQKDAKVEVETGELNFLNVEVFTCCEEFEKHVREALKDDLDAARDEFLREMTASEKSRLTRGALDSGQGPDRKAA